MIFTWKIFIFIFVIIFIIVNEEYDIAKNKKRDLFDNHDTIDASPINESK